MIKMIKKGIKLGMLEVLIETYGKSEEVTKADLFSCVESLHKNGWLTEKETLEYTKQIMAL